MTELPEEDFAKPIHFLGRYKNPCSWNQPCQGKCSFKGEDNNDIPDQSELDKTLPIHLPDFKKFEKSSEKGIRVAWLGHATMLVQFDGITILTDPIFSKKFGQTPVCSKKRYRDAPCRVEDLPHIDIVIISTNHFDHMDYKTIEDLKKRFGPQGLAWFVPKGTKCLLKWAGFKNITEMTWWQEEELPNFNGIKVACTPCQNWSSRCGIVDMNSSLWSSWCVIGPYQRFFFVGDTGYCEAFKQIGKHYGPFSLAAIPIGPRKSSYFSCPEKVESKDAAQIHLDVQAEKSIGIHWGTFKFSKEFYLDPRDKLKDEIEKRNLSTEDFYTMDHGEIRLV